MIRRIWPLLLISIISVLITLAGFIWAISQTGSFCYALDDSFIMMALAKNLAFHGNWGLTPYQFSSTASSPLFAVLLAAADLVFGEHIWMPLLINALVLFLLYALVFRLCRRWGFSQNQIFIALAGLFVFMPVPVLIFGSMEHLLHTLIGLLCLALVLEFESGTPPWLFLIAGMLLSSIRYEGLFEGGILILWLWKQGRFLKGFFLGTGMLIPVCALGFYSISQGWFFLPNSLILKAYGMNMQETGSFLGFLVSLLSKAANYPHCMVAFFSLMLINQSKGFEKGQNTIWAGVLLLMSLAHFLFSRYGHVFRYEAYLMGLSWLVIWKTLVQSGFASRNYLLQLIRKKDIMVMVLIPVMALSPVYRSIISFVDGSIAMVNIFEQQVQTALFVKSFYNKDRIAAIDVGAIAYYADCRLEDLWGLGTMDFARLKLEGRYGPHEIDSVCRKLGVEMAIGYGNPIREPGWKIAGSWAIQNNQVCARDTVDFYALNPLAFQKLKKNLDEFRSELPSTVLVIRPSDK